LRDLIDSVASLTTLRNRDELEYIVASVMFELIGPSRLTMWRLVSHSGELRLEQRARLAHDSVAVSDPLIDVGDLPTLNSRDSLRACYDSKVPLRLPREPGREHGYVFPVTSELELVGLLEIEHQAPLLTEQERLICGILRIYQNYLGVLDYGERDELTGLLNRKTFHDYFTSLVSPQEPSAANPASSQRAPCIERVDRYRRRLATGQNPWLAVADIDHFKRINDRFGHAYGDEVLVLMARLMRSCFRGMDRVFRFGGEEFVVILEHIEACHAERALERLRAAVEAFQFPQVGNVTISIGSTCVVPGDNGSDALGRADEALYVAKQRGRNQICCHERLVTEHVLEPKSLATAGVELF
jgi:diguanylate cyclase (GGDEF)-like protein